MTADPRTLAAKLRQDYASLRVSINGQGHLPVTSLADAADFIESVVPLHDAWLAAKPPCKTCGGKGEVADLSRPSKWFKPCPACPDSPGVQPFAEWVAGLVALWGVVHGPECDSEHWATSEARVAIHCLRQIGGTR